LKRLADGYRNTWVIPEAAAVSAEELKARLEGYFKLAALPVSLARLAVAPSSRLEQYSQDVKGQLSPAERKQFAAEALDGLWRMARGEITGYDLRPALPAVVKALRTEDLAVKAAEILGRLPGVEPQQRLAGLILDPKAEKVRLTAAVELNRHIQQYGLVLAQTLHPEQVRQLRALADNPAEDAALRTQVALLIGRMGVTAQQSGVRLYRYTPEPPAAPPAPKKE
jgi:hypothetical protein